MLLAWWMPGVELVVVVDSRNTVSSASVDHAYHQ